jgi:UDP-glucose 4-epimerase
MRICVTGATGKIGQSLVRWLSARPGTMVRALTRTNIPTPDALGERPARIEWLRGNLASAADCERLVDGQDVIVHLAHTNAPLTADGDLAMDAEINLLPTLQLLQAVQRGGRRPHVVFASSGGAVYAPSAGRHRLREEDPCLPAGAYGIQKLAAEHYVRLVGERGHLTACILRISTAYGWLIPPTRQQGFIGVALYQALRDEPVRILGNPDNVRDYLHIDDLLTATDAAMSLREGVVTLNIGSGVGTSVREAVALIERVLGRTVRTVEETRESARYLPAWSVLDISKARQMLGWQPRVALEEGIRRVIAQAPVGGALPSD